MYTAIEKSQLLIDLMPNAEFWLSQGSCVDSQLLKDSSVDLVAWDSQKAYDEFMKLAKELKLINN